MVLVVALHGQVVDNSVTLDVSGVRTILHDDRWSVQVDTVVNNQQRVRVVNDIVVNRNTVQILLQQVLEEEILLLQRSLLLLNGKLIEMHLVVALVEVVKLLKLVVRVRINSNNLIDHLLRLLLGVGIALVEWKDLFFLSFELTAELSCLQNALTKALVASKSLHALQTVGHESAQMLLLLLTELLHLLFEVVVVVHDCGTLTFESIVTIVVFTLDLRGLESKSLGLLLYTVDRKGHRLDVSGRPIVAVEKLRVHKSLWLGLVHVLLETDFEGVVEVVNLLDEIHLHSLLLLNILVTGLLLLSKEGFVDLLELGLFLFLNGVDHLTELSGLRLVSTGDIRLLPVILFLENADVSVEFFLKTTHARALKINQVIDVNQMVSKGHLILFLGFVEVTIKHLKDSILGIDLTIVVLLVDLNLLFQGFCL